MNLTKLEDDSLMPFGKHRGKQMMHVPVEYLHWFWTEGGGKHNMNSDVSDYIRRNLDALQMENKDLIWK